MVNILQAVTLTGNQTGAVMSDTKDDIVEILILEDDDNAYELDTAWHQRGHVSTLDNAVSI